MSQRCFVNIDSYYFYIESALYDYDSKRTDPVMLFFKDYKNPLYSRTSPTTIQKTFPLFPPSLNTIPNEYKIIDYYSSLNLEARVPEQYHPILEYLREKMNPKKIKEWGILIHKLKKKLLENGISKDELDFFNNKYKAVIGGAPFYFRRTKRLNISKGHRPFIASIGGITQYSKNCKENSWKLLRWGQIIVHYFRQENIRSYGIHIAFDIPCSEEDIKIISKRSRLTPNNYGPTTYYHFTKDRRSRLCIYNKSQKDGGYHHMIRIELVISSSEMKRLDLYSLHCQNNGVFSKDKIQTLAKYILKRLGCFTITYKNKKINLPSQSIIEKKIKKFLYVTSIWATTEKTL